MRDTGADDKYRKDAAYGSVLAWSKLVEQLQDQKKLPEVRGAPEQGPARGRQAAASNTRVAQGARRRLLVGLDFVRQQMDSVFGDLAIGAVKIGMLGTAEVIAAVAAGLQHWRSRWIVLDPVMVAKSGDKLLADEAVDALRTRLLPLASLITPNLPEAGVLLGQPAPTAPRDGGRRRAPAGPGARDVLLKGRPPRRF